MTKELGVKNRFYDKRHMEPQRWSSIETPAVYICFTIVAIMLYVGLTMKDSQLE